MYVGCIWFFLIGRRPPRSTLTEPLLPFTTLFRLLHCALVARLAGRYGVDELCPQSRSITLAMRQIEEHCERAWDAESLAAATGVTVPTLRRGFRACLGTSIGTFIQQARLQWAYTCLASGHDSRQMTAIAESVGYRTAGSFSRAYQKRFGDRKSTRLNSVTNAHLVCRL